MFFFIASAIPTFINIKYSKIYKEEVIKKVIEDNNFKIEYFPELGMSKEEYKFADFENFDKYESEDLITGEINGIKYSLADVHTYRRETDSDGDTKYVTIFEGAVSRLEIPKNLNAFIYIVDNKVKLFSNKYFVSIDNEAFEKEYDVYSDNDILAMRILTPDVTTKILDLTNKTGIYTEIKIYYNVIYFRFYTGDLFKANIWNVDKEALNIAFYFELLKGINDIMLNILKVIDEVIL